MLKAQGFANGGIVIENCQHFQNSHANVKNTDALWRSRDCIDNYYSVVQTVVVEVTFPLMLKTVAHVVDEFYRKAIWKSVI